MFHQHIKNAVLFFNRAAIREITCNECVVVIDGFTCSRPDNVFKHE
jgi:hypothetical protein